MKRRIVANVFDYEAARHVFRYKDGRLEIGDVIKEDKRSSDRYGNYDITVKWPDGSLMKTRSFWVRWISKDVDMDMIMDIVNMFNINKIDISNRERIASFLVDEYDMDWDEAIELSTEYEKYGKQLTTQSFCHVRN